MKSRILQSVASILFVISVTPALCRAQAEVDPDHFDSPNTVATVAKSATSNRNVSQNSGSFFLPFEVACAGAKLKPGHYSVSIQQSGKRDRVTLTRIVNGIPVGAIEVTATPRLSARGPNALVVDRVNQQRTLTAINLQELGVTLFLQSGKQGVTSVNAQPILVSYSAAQAIAPKEE